LSVSVVYISATQTMGRGPAPGRGGLLTGPWIETWNLYFVLRIPYNTNI